LNIASAIFVAVKIKTATKEAQEMFKQFFLSAALAAMTLLTSIDALAQTKTIRLVIPNCSYGFRVSIGETVSIPLPRRMFVHKVLLQVDSTRGNSGAELTVNGDRKGNMYLTSADPQWIVTVEQETSSLQLTGIQPISTPCGTFNVRAVDAVVSETDITGNHTSSTNSTNTTYQSPCHGCYRLNFPLYYTTVMGNVSNRAIILIDRLQTFADCVEYGKYLLPIKKAAANARSVAEARGDASAYGRPYYEALLIQLDLAEPYLINTFERSAVFQWANELLTLREYIRDILD